MARVLFTSKIEVVDSAKIWYEFWKLLLARPIFLSRLLQNVSTMADKNELYFLKSGRKLPEDCDYSKILAAFEYDAQQKPE